MAAENLDGRIKFSTDDTFSKVIKRSPDTTPELLNSQIQLLLDLVRRYSIEMTYYQYLYGITGEQAGQIADAISGAVGPVNSQLLNQFLQAIDKSQIDLLFPLLFQYDQGIELRNQQLENSKQALLSLEGKMNAISERFRSLETTNQSLSEELLNLYQKGFVDDVTGATFNELERLSVKNYVKTVEKENSEIKEQFQSLIDKVAILETNLRLQTELALNAQHGMDRYIREIETLTAESLSAERKVSELDELLFEAKTQLSRTKTELQLKIEEIIVLKAKIEQLEDQQEKSRFLDNKSDVQRSQTFIEKVEKSDLLLEVKTLKSMNEDLLLQLKSAHSENFKLTKNLNDSAAKIEDLMVLSAELERKNKDLQEVNSKLSQNLALYQTVDGEVKSEHQKVIEVKSKFRQEMESVYTAKNREISELKEDAKVRLEKLKAAHAREISDFKRQVQILQTNTTNYKLQIDELRATNDAKASKDDHLEETLSKVALQKDAIIDRLNTEIQELHRELTELKIKQIG